MSTSAIFAIIMLVISAASAAINMNQVNAANQANINATKDINTQNLEQQTETLEQQQQFSREAAAQSDAYTRGLFRDLYSPQARVQQLREAGLSVGLMYGQGGMGGTSSTSGAQATTPSATTATAIAPLINPALLNIENMLNSVSLLNESKKTETDIAKTTAETKKIEVEIKNIEAKTNTEVLSQAGIKLDNKTKQLDNKLKEGNLENSFKLLEEQLKQIKIINEKTEREIEGLRIDNQNKQEMYNLAKKQGAQSIAESISRVALNNANKLLAEAKTITEEKVREEIEAKCNILILQAEEIQQRIEKGRL